MKSIGFPRIFNKNSTKLSDNIDATRQNMSVLLQCDQGELTDDPYFGINLKGYMFDQNNYILRDLLIDDIYTQLAVFMPQLILSRDDITIVQDGTTVSATISAKNKLNYETNMYSIRLFNTEEGQ